MRKVLELFVFFAVLNFSVVSCGGGGGGSGNADQALATSSRAEVDAQPDCANAVPLTEDLQSVWSETEQCTALEAPPPRVVFSPTVVCPRNGLPECLATVPFSPCADDPSQTCGAIGRFLPACRAIELPDDFFGAAAHEMIHYLLWTNGRSDWEVHTGPEWVCQ